MHAEKNKIPSNSFKEDVHRILSSKAFRRLKGKTQVVISNTGDHYRDRLTHTIQVAHTAQIIAERLGLNQDLAHAIALAHDLGHTPFGHSGEDALDKMLQDHGLAFEHNMQSVRIVQELEEFSPNYKGLNLHLETIMGLHKHNKKIQLPSGQLVSHSLEAQLVNEADEITYLFHDLDDAYRSKLISKYDLQKLSIYPQLNQTGLGNKNFHEIIEEIYFHLISELIRSSKQQIQNNNIHTYQDVLKANKPLIIYSKLAFEAKLNLKHFLYQKFWTDTEIIQQREYGQKIIKKLFDFFLHDPSQLPKKYQLQIRASNSIIETVKDYIAGMTDIYAKELYIKNALS